MNDHEPQPDITIIIIDRLAIDTARCQVNLDGQPISLCSQEYKLLVYLARNADRVITKEELWRGVWGDAENKTHDQIKSSIKRLRESVELNPKEPRYILTVRGHGYLMPSQPLTKGSSA